MSDRPPFDNDGSGRSPVFDRLVRMFFRRPEQESIMPPPAFQPLPPIEHLLAHVQPAVDAGYLDRDEIVERAKDIAGEEGFLLTNEKIEAIVDERLAEHAARQAGWPAITDNDRLDAASMKLESEGIVVRGNFTCCGSCGITEIWEEIELAKKAGILVKGYAFYHSQDVEGVAEGEHLRLSYGSTEAGDAPSIAIAKRIVEILRDEGLTVHWNGTFMQRIGIDLEWRKRRDHPAASSI